MDVFVARQPIFNTAQKVVGYELLFRDGLKNSFPDIDGNVATSNLLSNTFFSFELKEILRNKPGFINFTQDLLLQKTPLLFPKTQVVIEVLEDIQPSSEIIQALKEFKANGYQVALDDYIDHPKFDPMVAISDIVKIDFQFHSKDDIQSTLNRIEKSRNKRFLAEKVETRQEYELAKKMGFTLFQGYFFSRPEILAAKDITPGQITKLKLIRELQKQDMDIDRIQALVKQDLSISYKLLKFINSAYFARPTPIDTIKDAITYMGIDELQKFLSIIAVSDLNKEAPQELLRRSVIRARMCEKIGPFLKTGFSKDELFTLGLFTFMDALVNHKMEDILKLVGFSNHMNRALLGQTRGFNTLISIITCFEKGEWGKGILSAISGKQIEQQLPSTYFDSVKMANSFFD